MLRKIGIIIVEILMVLTTLWALISFYMMTFGSFGEDLQAELIHSGVASEMVSVIRFSGATFGLLVILTTILGAYAVIKAFWPRKIAAA